MLTCYDYSTAKLEEEAGINGILVGDSLGNVMLGLPDTISVTMEDMITFGHAVARACHNTMVVIDMPFMSYQVSVEQAVMNAGRLMKEGRANAVKLEGGAAVCPQIKAITDAGIPVMAHLGYSEGWCLCRCSGMYSCQAGGYDYQEAGYSYHRYWCGSWL